MSNVSRKINDDFHSFSSTRIVKTLLYGNKKYKNDVNTYILNQTINFIKNSKRFEKALDDDDVEIWFFSFSFSLGGGGNLG